MSHFEKKVQLNKIIESQLPEFLVADFPKAVDFFRQYYISQEAQGGNIDLVDNLDRYLKLDNLIPEVIINQATLSADISASDTTITVSSTKGYPDDYGLLKIDDEIITYTGKTDTSFTGCIRGFSGVTGFDDSTKAYFVNTNRQSVIFEDTAAASHSANASIQNLSALFLQEFYKKLKKTFTPGFEEETFVSDLDVANFIRNARTFYQSKGIEESVVILFKVLYGVTAKVIDLESRLIKPSSADYIRREVIVAESISGNPFGLEGQTIFKSNDLTTNAAVSDVEIFTRDTKTFYKIGLFIGYNDRDLVEGTFEVPGFSRVLETVSPGASVISVDSTIGFGQTGSIITGDLNIDYTSKSINQFFGCTGITSSITLGAAIRADETIFGYEDGDVNKKSELRITGVLSDFEAIDDIPLMEVGEEISVRNVGDIIRNPDGDKTYKEVFGNSWIYNTSTRFNVESIQGASFFLYEDIDKASLRVGDSVDILIGSSNIVDSANAVVDSISGKEISLSNISGFVPSPTQTYSIRRNLIKSTSLNTPIIAGNDVYIANTLNVYTDDADTTGYVASHSLPGYEILDEIIESVCPDGTEANLGGYSAYFKNFSTVKFANSVRFIDGDEIRYVADNQFSGLVSGELYYVKLVTSNEIRLYASKSLLGGNEFVRIGPNLNAGTHTFTLRRHEDKKLSSNNILRKFPLNQTLAKNKEVTRNLGNIGILINGVEISSPESRDRIYYGPLDEFNVLNGGRDYDVVNPPKISISAGTGSTVGLVTALVEPIVIGSVKEVLVDPQDFDVDDVLSVSIVGGNGSGCVLEPVTGSRFREIEFDSRARNLGGGVDVDEETITFLSNHNLITGQHVIYNHNDNNPIAIGDPYDINNLVAGTLVSGDEYVVRVVNNSSIRLFKSEADALSGGVGVNTIGLSKSTSASGIHKFRTLTRNNLREVKVLNSGSGYTYRKLRVKASGISTIYNTVSHKDHGFETGETIIYSPTENTVVGLNTTNQYKVDKIDSNTFRLINIGIGGTDTTDSVRSKYVDFTDSGSGYHIFQYPPIEVVANVSYGGTTGTFNFTPVITGEIAGAYLYEGGTGYGSTTLNLHQKPIVKITQGTNAQLAPIINNGKIVEVQVLTGGSDYVSLPELVVEDNSGSGTGAILRPVITDNKISDVIVINTGIGYSAAATSIYVRSRGFGAKFDTRVRYLDINDAERFGQFSKTQTKEIFSNLYKNEKENSLVYGIFGYSQDLAENIEPLDGNHSPIIGWAYDGNPIYGPFGYEDPKDIQSGVRLVKTGYELESTAIFDRPDFTPGFFVDDYRYAGTGDLDKHNGRFGKTPEFPNGVYAYFVGVTTSQTSPNFEPQYPYFIGNTYRSEIIPENFTLDHKFDFNNSKLVRNTFPYNVNRKNADYDFINEGYETYDQLSVVESVTQGVPDIVDVIDGGVGYKIGDRVNFNSFDTNGAGFRAEVSELVGAAITSVNTSLTTYENVVFEWLGEKQVAAYNMNGFDLNPNDSVLISGLSTSVTALAGSTKIGFTTEVVSLAATMSQYVATPYGRYEDIILSTKFNNISIGNTMRIVSSVGFENVTILNDYNNGILRVKRHGVAGLAHTVGSRLEPLNDRLLLPLKTKKFESKRNQLVFFNPAQSVGVGTTPGSSVIKNFEIGITSTSVDIPTQQIHIPNHPFKTGQKVKLSMSGKPGLNQIIVGNDDSNTNTFNIPFNVSELYVIDKGRNFIGLTTQVGLTTAGNGLFFYNDGSDNAEYRFETTFSELTGDLSRITTKISCGATHGLEEGDTIKLNLIPNTIVGLGTTAACTVAFNEDKKLLLINPTGITSAGINTTTNRIIIDNHGYKTGDRVFYESVEPAEGLETNTSYYVIRDSSDEFRLAETLYESNPLTEKSLNLVGTGDTNHKFSLINPQINVTKNSDLQFNLQDPSLKGYNLRIYNENSFTNEYISSYDSRDFNVVGVGSIGIGTASNASLTIKHSKSSPSKLYYAIEKGGYISTADKDVINFSEINYIDSEYNGTYKVHGVGSTTFNISPVQMPIVLDFLPSQCDTLEYTTKSANALNGSIGKVEILSKGFNYEQLPKFTDVTSVNGNNANVAAISTSIGRIKKVRFKDIGYDYPSDKTLRPEAIVPPIVRIDNLDTITDFDVRFAGRRYLSDPDLLVWNDTTNTLVDSTSLVAKAPNGAISEIELIAPILGLDSEPHRVIAINNSNGVGIVSMTTSMAGVATCTLTTPILGFTTVLFNAGDSIFVEGIEMVPGSGDGYNSADYNYKFFKVLEYNNTSPAILKFQVIGEDGVGITTNAGIAVTFQSGYATIINKNDYPDIRVIQERAKFVENEALFVDTGTGYFETDLRVTLVRDDYIKISGDYNLTKGSKIKGIISGAISDVTSVTRKKAKFNIGYSSKLELGWKNDIGKISEDYQVIPDNDYYQNLSYSVKSPITWDEFSAPVNSIIHPAGLKNFADVGISSLASTKVSLGGTTTSIVVLDVVSEGRVDTINNFDNAIDDDPRQSGIGTFLQSNSLQIQNRKLTDFTECRTNRVLIHDDISDKFSSKGFQDIFVELEEIDFIDNHVRYLIQILDPDNGYIQVSELVVQSTTLDIYLFEKYSAHSHHKLGSFRADVDSFGRKTLIFDPVDPYNTDHDIKILKKTYLYQALPTGSSGIGTQSIGGSVDLVSSFVSVGNTLGNPETKTIAEFDVNDFNGAFASVEIADRFSPATNYIEATLDFDGNNTHLSEYYFDTTTKSYSATQTGILSAVYDANSGIVSLTAYNTGISSSPFDIRSNIVGFAATTSGIGTYRFLLNDQPPGSEKSVRLESTVGFGSTAVTLGTFDIDDISSSTSVIRVSAGETSAIHQVNIMSNNKDMETFVVPGPFAPVNNTTGLGTFGGEIIGSNFYLNFYPDQEYNVDGIEAQSFNEVLYRENDFDNQPNPLSYGPSNQLILLSAFDGLNGIRANRVNFKLTHQGHPIYTKFFNPADTTKIDYETGLFTFPNHFFNTGEELLYTPGSTFAGIGQTSVGIGTTENYAGIVTDRLPEKVYPIAVTPDSFKLATKEEYARAGIFVTFTDAGIGNAHELEITKKLTKTVIALDGIVQQPISFTPINHTLNFNNGGISAGIATFNISGISSVQPRDILKIDDEYMKVIEVGLSTNFNGQLLGPINGIIAAGTAATHPTVAVERGIVGTAATSHTDGAEVRIYRGSINIVKNEVFFVDPPKGNTRARRNEANLPYVRAEFSGRTFLRSNYDTNMLFDDISDSFSGIGKTYTTTIQGINTSGIEPGNGILFINGVFQTPSTENNAGNNYIFENDNAAGISSVVFTGITSTDGSYIESEFDINQNQIPRGGLVVSVGSTPGLGYAPLVGAKVVAKKDSSGALTEIVGINTWTRPVSISTASYNKYSGIIEIETSDSHNLKTGDRVKLVGLHFTCTPAYTGVTTTIFPDHDRSFDIQNIISATELSVNVGPSSITHLYNGGGEVYEFFSLNHGSGYRGPVSIAVTDHAYVHRFERAVTNAITADTSAQFTPTGAKYTSHTGELQLTMINHGLTTSNTITIADDSLIFRCSDDDFFTEQPYPRSTDPASGSTLTISSVTDNTITVNVGPGGGAGTGAVVSATVGAGGTLAFTIDNPGTGYINPAIQIPEPNYENMPVRGVSRLGIGATTDTGKNLLLNLTVGAAGTVGIGSTLFNINSFKIARNGYAFKPGDIVEVVGLVTAKDYTDPIEPFQVEITQTFNDFFSAWSFGEMDYIDNVKGYQNGNRKRFPLFYNGELLSFEIDPNDPLSGAIDLDSVLLIFINGVLQTPGYAYQFTGGTSFVFTEAPRINDQVDIFFYVGRQGVDVGITTVTETLKVGDDLFVKKHPKFQETVDQLLSRTIAEIAGSDKVETPVYTGPGVNQNTFKPFNWIKQKRDKFIKGDIVYKTRDSIEPKIFPTAKIISDVNVDSTQIFVDNAQFFDYDEIIYDLNVNTFEFDAFMMEHKEPISAEFDVSVGAGGTITSISITNPGFGYTTSSIDVKFAAPVGVGSTASATATVSAAGTVTSVTLTSVGSGYTSTNLPNTIAPLPTAKFETIADISNVQGFSGIITGISETTGTGGQKAIKFNFVGLRDYGVNGESQVASDVLDLVPGYPIMIYDTKVGQGGVSVYDSDAAVVGVGTTFLDNIYVVDSISSLAANGEIICNVTSTTDLTGITSTGRFDENEAGLTTSLGTLSWGRIYNFNERTTSPISIGVTGLTVDSGLSTFPTIQRRGNFGQGKSGAVRSRKPVADPNLIFDNDLPFYSG